MHQHSQTYNTLLDKPIKTTLEPTFTSDVPWKNSCSINSFTTTAHYPQENRSNQLLPPLWNFNKDKKHQSIKREKTVWTALISLFTVYWRIQSAWMPDNADTPLIAWIHWANLTAVCLLDYEISCLIRWCCMRLACNYRLDLFQTHMLPFYGKWRVQRGSWWPALYTIYVYQTFKCLSIRSCRSR